MPKAFDEWKQRLIESAGCASPSVRLLGDYVLELFWKDGCEPTVAAMLDYAQAGLCGKFDIRVADSSPRSSSQHRRENIPDGGFWESYPFS